MEAVILITILALLQYFWFSIEVGKMRAKHECKAPSITGAAEFECMFRVHQNTLEQLVIFLPALWLFAHYVNPLWAAGFGVVYLVGRAIYRVSYVKDPSTRSMGFMLSSMPSAIMILWVLVVTIMKMLG